MGFFDLFKSGGQTKAKGKGKPGRGARKAAPAAASANGAKTPMRKAVKAKAKPTAKPISSEPITA